MVGKTIAHHQILDKLGEDGMGVVWIGEDVHMRRVVALKFLHASDDLPRLLREAQTADSLNHPNICTVYEVDPELGFRAMEFVEGKSLKDIIGGRPVPVKETLRIALQIGEGLKATHNKQITHRDIKPANIMVTAVGLVKIMDFGLARIAGQARLTLDGVPRLHLRAVLKFELLPRLGLVGEHELKQCVGVQSVSVVLAGRVAADVAMPGEGLEARDLEVPRRDVHYSRDQPWNPEIEPRFKSVQWKFPSHVFEVSPVWRQVQRHQRVADGREHSRGNAGGRFLRAHRRPWRSAPWFPDFHHLPWRQAQLPLPQAQSTRLILTSQTCTQRPAHNAGNKSG